MSRIKVGSRVTLKKNMLNGIRGSQGIVIGTDASDIPFYIKLDNGKYQWAKEESISLATPDINEAKLRSRLELMTNKFKIGDRVITVGSAGKHYTKGLIGTIVRDDYDVISTIKYGVKFDDERYSETAVVTTDILLAIPYLNENKLKKALKLV